MKKFLSLLLSLVLILSITVPGTLAQATETEEVTHIETCLEDCEGVDCACDCHKPATVSDPTETSAPTDPSETTQPSEATQPSDPTNPSEATQPSDPTDPSEATQPSDPTDPTESAPTEPTEATQPTEPEITHIEGCTADCTTEGCTCECHLSLYEKLMATTSIEEFEAVVDKSTDEEWEALTEEQLADIDAHYVSMEPAPVPAVVFGVISEDPVQSEIVSVTVNFANVADFVNAG